MSCCWSYQPKTYSKKVPVMVGSRIIDRAMGMIMKGELVRATATWKRPTSVWLCPGHYALNRVTPSVAPTLLHPRNSVWTMSMGMSIPHRGSPFLCLGPSIFMATQTSEDTVCRSTCLPSQHEAPSCPLPWY